MNSGLPGHSCAMCLEHCPHSLRLRHSVPCLLWYWLISIIVMAPLSLSHVCTFSLLNRRWYWALCDAMCCYALSNAGVTPALSFASLACWWAQNHRGIYVLYVSEWESDFPFYLWNIAVCVCAHGYAHGHMTAPWLWVCEDDKWGVISHPGLSEHYLKHWRLYLTGHRPRQAAFWGLSTYIPLHNYFLITSSLLLFPGH